MISGRGKAEKTIDEVRIDGPKWLGARRAYYASAPLCLAEAESALAGGDTFEPEASQRNAQLADEPREARELNYLDCLSGQLIESIAASRAPRSGSTQGLLARSPSDRREVADETSAQLAKPARPGQLTKSIS